MISIIIATTTRQILKRKRWGLMEENVSHDIALKKVNSGAGNVIRKLIYLIPVCTD